MNAISLLPQMFVANKFNLNNSVKIILKTIISLVGKRVNEKNVASFSIDFNVRIKVYI
jgi:hypothetical protein